MSEKTIPKSVEYIHRFIETARENCISGSKADTYFKMIGIEAKNILNSHASLTAENARLREALTIAHDVLHKCRSFISDRDEAHTIIGEAVSVARHALAEEAK